MKQRCSWGVVKGGFISVITWVDEICLNTPTPTAATTYTEADTEADTLMPQLLPQHLFLSTSNPPTTTSCGGESATTTSRC